MLHRLFAFVLVATFLLTSLGGCSASKPTSNPNIPAGDIKGKETKSGTRSVGTPQ